MKIGHALRVPFLLLSGGGNNGINLPMLLFGIQRIRKFPQEFSGTKVWYVAGSREYFAVRNAGHSAAHLRCSGRDESRFVRRAYPAKAWATKREMFQPSMYLYGVSPMV